MKRTIEYIDVTDKKVLLRVDFNVPLDENGRITDDTRIVEELPTIKYLLERKAKIILCSHLGRPDGKVVESMSLFPVAKRLIELLPLTKIKFVHDCIGAEVEEKAKTLKSGEILLLENLRFHSEEEDNEPTFAKKLASLAEVYVDDAFGTAHRMHASNYGVAKLLPNAVGFLMGKEINAIINAIENPVRPFVAVLGGAKISDKIYVVLNLMKKVDTILIGGGMAYTFLKAKGFKVGSSLVDNDKLELAKKILMEADRAGVQLKLPVDHLCAYKFVQNAGAYRCGKDIKGDMIGLDIGPKTVSQYKKILRKANTIIWNGPLGMFEFDNFGKGTMSIAKTIANPKKTTIVGGGDSIAAIDSLKLEKKISHISTGGGASLKLFAGEILPGVEVIENLDSQLTPKFDKHEKKLKE